MSGGLLTVRDLASHMHADGFAAKDRDAAARAVEYACAQVRLRLGFDVMAAEVDGVPIEAHDVTAARGVALRTAAQWFTNPQDRASFSGPEGMAYQPSPQVLSRIMSEADRVTLQLIQLKYAPGFG